MIHNSPNKVQKQQQQHQHHQQQQSGKKQNRSLPNNSNKGKSRSNKSKSKPLRANTTPFQYNQKKSSSRIDQEKLGELILAFSNDIENGVNKTKVDVTQLWDVIKTNSNSILEGFEDYHQSIPSTHLRLSSSKVSDVFYLLIKGTQVLHQIPYSMIHNSHNTTEQNQLHQQQDHYVETLSTELWESISSIMFLSLKRSDGDKASFHHQSNKKKKSVLALTSNQIQDSFSIVTNQIRHLLNEGWTLDNNQSLTSDHDQVNGKWMEKVYFRCKVLRDLIAGFGADLSAEQAISPMVNTTILPLLKITANQLHRSASSSSYHCPTTVISCHDLLMMIMEIILRILGWKQHTSAILAPLVIHVGNRGEEKSNINPLRGKLLDCLVNIVLTDENDLFSMSSCCACKCLTALLDGVCMIDKGATSWKKLSNLSKDTKEKNSDGFNVGGVLKWIRNSLQSTNNDHVLDEKSLRWYVLGLLVSIMKLYPQTSAQNWALFLPQAHNREVLITSNTGESMNEVTLLSLISSEVPIIPNPTEEEKTLAIEACSILLSVLPLHLWRSNSKRSISSANFGYLSNRVEASLGQLIYCIRKEMSLCRSRQVFDALCSLAEIFCSSVPFDGYDRLNQPTKELFQLIGDHLIHDRNDALLLLSGAKLLANCMGGSETPQGTLTPLPDPARIWLLDSSSSVLVDHLFQSITNVETNEVPAEYRMLVNEKTTLLLKLIRSMPSIITRSSQRYELFSSLVQKLTINENSTDKKLLGLHLLQGFIEGQNIISRDTTMKDEIVLLLPELIINLHLMLTNVDDESIRRCVCVLLGSLQFAHWKLLLLSSEENPFIHLLPLCLEYSGETNSSARSEACRSVGNIISVCMDNTHDHDEKMERILAEMVEGAIQVMSSALVDSDSSVRLNALFTIGNIAHSLAKGKRKEKLLKSMPLIHLCESSFKRIKDENDKVVSNAIRTIGHLFHLLYNSHDIIKIRPDDSLLYIQFCGTVAEELASKINIALSDVTNDQSNNRSWKQRSFAKKHAWGSCSSLSSLLGCSATLQKVSHKGIRLALLQLIRCVEMMKDVNEKIAMTALSTLSCVPEETWRYYSKSESILGACISACLVQITTDPISNFNMKTRIETLTRNVLLVALVPDVLHCVSQQQQICDRNLNILYDWMVMQQSFQSKHFDVWGRALFQSDYDISLIQKFESRAVLEERKETSRNDQEISRIPMDGDDDEEDEL